MAGLRAAHGYFLGRLGRLEGAHKELELSAAHLRKMDGRSDLALALTL